MKMNIAVIGAGPRGLSLCERLIAQASVNQQSLSLTLIDPYPPGGAIWQTNQPQSLLLNSVTSQVTLFTDETLATGGPINPGPSLYEWAKKDGRNFAKKNQPSLVLEIDNLDPDGHCSRALYGLYQKWFYQQLIETLPPFITLTYLQENAIGLKLKQTCYLLETDSHSFQLDRVILAVGHHQVLPTEEENRLNEFARQKGFLYSPPQNAADVDFHKVKGGEPVILRGLGLAFFDYVTRLTTDRGGVFIGSDHLRYIPSGNEPLIIAGSGRGVPYHARGANQKQPTEQITPRFLTTERLRSWQVQGPDQSTEFFFYLQKEMELVYYQRWLSQESEGDQAAFQSAFTEQFVRQNGATDVLIDFQIPRQNWLDWRYILDPYERKEGQSLRDFLLTYLTWDVTEAAKGNLTSPISSMFELLKDLRDPLRFMLDHQLFSPKALKETFWQSFVPLNAFLSIGPPLQRIRELIALIEADIVTILGPKMTLEESDTFVAYSTNYPQQRYSAEQVLEARIQSTDIRRTANPLLRQLLADGIAHPHKLYIPEEPPFYTGAIAVDPTTGQLLDPNDQVQEGLYCFGIPTEGIHWLTAATAQPGTNAWNLRQADQMAAHCLTRFLPEAGSRRQ
jgi:hypothetical protein